MGGSGRGSDREHLAGRIGEACPSFALTMPLALLRWSRNVVLSSESGVLSLPYFFCWSARGGSSVWGKASVDKRRPVVWGLGCFVASGARRRGRYPRPSAKLVAVTPFRSDASSRCRR